MADSIQLAILKLLTTHLQGITALNGYDYDLSSSVYRGKLLFGEETSAPFLSIVEHLQGDVSTGSAGENNIEHEETWLLLVQGIAKNDVKNPTDDLYNLKAAVEHRLARLILMEKGDPVFPAEYFLGIKSWKVITGFTIGPGIVSPPRQGISEKAFFYLPLGVGLALNVSEPYEP